MTTRKKICKTHDELLHCSDKFVKCSMKATEKGKKHKLDELLHCSDNLSMNRFKDIIKEMKDNPPKDFTCPISLDIMRDPVMLSDGRAYEKLYILEHLKKDKTSPITREPLKPINFTVKQLRNHQKSQQKSRTRWTPQGPYNKSEQRWTPLPNEPENYIIRNHSLKLAIAEYQEKCDKALDQLMKGGGKRKSKKKYKSKKKTKRRTRRR